MERRVKMTSVKILRQSLLVLMLAVSTFGCLGRATPPEQVKMTQQQNEVLGKFARRVGEQELNILLKDPNDATLPGIPVGDLLYILSKVNEDRLITLVQGIGATSTLELILAIKRVACTRYTTLFGGTAFDARILTGPGGMNSCTWQHIHIPNIMVQLLNGATTNGLTTLIDTVKHSYTSLGLAANKPLQVNLPALVGNPTYDATVSHYAFLMKLAYIVVGFDTPVAADKNLSSESLIGPPKLYNLMNLTIDGRDMVFLLDSFDKNTCPAIASTASSCIYVDNFNILTTYDGSGNLWNDIAANQQYQGLQNLLSIMAQVTDTSKMGTLVNGRRTARYNLGQDEAQVRYYIDRLKVVLEHDSKLTKPVVCYDATAGTLYNTVTGTAAERQLQDYDCPQGGNGVWNTKLATLINLITNVNRMMELVYTMDDGFDINHGVAYTAPNRGIDNLLVLVNNVNSVAAHPAPNTTNNELITAAYLIDNVALDTLNANPAKRNKVKYLVEFMGNTLAVLQLACYTAVSDQIDGVPPTDATPEVCDNRGLINLTASGSKVDDASVADLTAAGQKLTNLTGQISEIEDMRFLVRKVTMNNMTQILAGLQIASTVNVANLVNQITGADCWDENFGAISTSVTAPGAGYTSPPTVNFFGGGGTPSAKAVIETDSVNFAATVGQVKDVIIIDSGDSFPAAPTAISMTLTGGGGAGATVTGRAGSCRFNAVTNEFRGFPSSSVAGATGATGLGKMVNVINHISGSPGTVVTLINGVTDGVKLGLLINGINRSSNLVGVMNATVDASRNNNATINDLILLLNTIPRVDVYKLVHMMDALGDATEVDSLITSPAGDHDMVAQLFAPYCRSDLASLGLANCSAGGFVAGNLVHSTSGVGVPAMATLISSLTITGGGGYTSGTVTGPNGLTAVVSSASGGVVTGIEMNNTGAGCKTLPTINITGGGGGAGLLVAGYLENGQVKRVNILNSGSGYASAPLIGFTGGGCTIPPVATAHINGIGSVTVVNGGFNFTNNAIALTLSAGPGAGAVLTPTVSGTLNSATGLASITGGTRYSTGQTCPIIGAGGSGGTCQVTANPAVNGTLTGCSAISGGANYGVGRIVKIGGSATAVAVVSGSSIATGLGSLAGGVKVVNTGCGYAAPPAVIVTGCSTPPVVAVIFDGVSGRVTDLNVTIAGSGCSSGTKVAIGETPYAYHSDGGSAIVNAVTAATGRVTSISVSDASVNAAQLVQLLDRDSTGNGFSFIYNATTHNVPSACSGGGAFPCVPGDTLRPNISTREAMVRLLHHGFSPDISSPKAWFNASLGATGPAGGVAGNYLRDWPGLGTQHIAGSILNNVGSSSTQTLINLMNSDTIALEDTLLLLGCGDRSGYSNGWTAFTWQALCTELGPGLW